MTAPTTQPNDASAQFSEASQQLEQTLGQLKSGNLSLEDSLKLFEQGVGHLKVCQTLLNQAKGRVDELIQTLGEDGQIVTEPFDEDSDD